MSSVWLIFLPLPAALWWWLGFPPGWGWVVLPMMPGMPVSLGELLVLVAFIIGGFAALVWLRNNFGPS